MYPVRRRIWPYLLGAAVLVVLGITAMFFLPNNSRLVKESVSRVESDLVMRGVTRSEEIVNQATSGEPEIATKMIYSGSVTLRAKDLLEAETKIEALVSEQGGYISDSRMGESQGEAYLRLVLRIPPSELENSLTYLGELGEIEERSLRAEDVTETYYDITSRLTNKQKQEERYLEILSQAVTVEDVLKVERELERIRGDIESLQGRLNYYQDRIDLATLTVTVRAQGGRVIGFSFTEAIKDAAEGFLASTRLLIVFSGRVLPWLVVLVIITLVGKGVGFFSR